MTLCFLLSGVMTYLVLAWCLGGLGFLKAYASIVAVPLLLGAVAVWFVCFTILYSTPLRRVKLSNRSRILGKMHEDLDRGKAVFEEVE